MVKVFVFNCGKITRIKGYSQDRTGGNLPLQGICDTWQFAGEVEISKDPYSLIGENASDVLNGIKKQGYYISSTKETNLA